MIILSFLALTLKRLKKRFELTLLLVLSFAMTIGIMVCVPVFVDAISMQILQEELDVKMETQNTPHFPVRFYAMPQYGSTMTLEEAAYGRDWIADMLVRQVGLPLKTVYSQSESPVFYLKPDPRDSLYQDRILAPIQVVLVKDVEQHIQVIEGSPFGSDLRPGRLHVWMQRPLADALGLQAGETFQLTNPQLPKAEPIMLRINGIWEPLRPAQRDYWSEDPSRLLDRKVLTTQAQYESFVYPSRPEQTYFHLWYYVLDDRSMSFARAEQYLAALSTVEREVHERLPSGRMDLSPQSELARGLQRRRNLSAVMFNLSLPLLIILVYFIGAVSAIAARFQRQEIAMLVSRGSSRTQILGIKLLEAGVMLIISCPLGVGLGLLLARLIGFTRGFLDFQPRPPVPVHVASIEWKLVAIGMLAGAVAYLVPSWLATRLSIVTYEQWSARRRAALGGMRILCILFLCLCTAYSYYKLNLIGSISLVGFQMTDSTFDPVLLASPSLFLFTFSVVFSLVFVYFTRPMAWIGKLLPSVAGYLGFVSLGREGEQYRTPVFIIVLCLCLGVFSASLAKSADSWLVDRRSYEVGADLVIHLESDSGLGATVEEQFAQGLSMASVPIVDYQQISGVVKAARVAEYGATPVTAHLIPELRLMAIDRTDFPQVAYFRDDFAQVPLGELMNRLGAQPQGLLLPSRLAEQMMVTLGDVVELNVRLGAGTLYPFRFTVVGTFDYFPTMYERRAYVAVANLDYLETGSGGGLPFGVWMRVGSGVNSEEITRAVRRMGLTPVLAGDLPHRIRTDQQRLERVGLLGMLSVCFLSGTFLAVLGFLVYIFSSIISQGLRFAVWQAIGIHRGEILVVISVQYLLTVLYGLLSGVVGGLAASKLFVPLFRLTDAVGQPIPPFTPMVDWYNAAWMAVVLGFAFLLVEAIILLRVSRTRVFEVLRMGNRE